MFESVQHEDAGQRLRNAAIAPLAAFLFALAYLAFYPLLPSVPAILFWFVDAVVLAGAVMGCVAIARAARRGAALGWLVGACIVELVCLAVWVLMTFPWI